MPAAGGPGGAAPLVWTTKLDALRVELVETARGPIEVARVGSGPAVMLAHGIPGSWRQAIPLAEDLDGFEVLLPSRPGYGATPLSSGRTYDEQADLYAALLDSLGIERSAIVGVSGGGPSAAAFAARHADRASAVVLVCALAPHLLDPPKAGRLLALPWVAELFAPAVRAVNRARLRRRGAVEAYMRRTLTPDEFVRVQADVGIRDDLVRHVLSHQVAPAGTAGLRNDYAQVLAAREPKFDASAVTCPVLVMHSDCDGVIPMSHAQFHAEALSGRLEVLEGAGHLFLVTRRGDASPRIAEFLRSAI